MTGLPTIHNSETDEAPAREITTSAYTKSILSIKRLLEHV
jgi:hypothetical protein